MVSCNQQCQGNVSGRVARVAGIFTVIACLSVEVVQAAVFDITADSSGGVIFSIGSPSSGGATRRIGSSTTAGTGLSNAYLFQLPTIPSGEFITQVDFGFNLVSQIGSFSYNADLYGLGFVNPAAMQASWFFDGPGTDSRARSTLGTGTTGSVSLIEDNILTTATSNGSIQSDEAASLLGFINSLYSDGAVGGDFAVFHLVADEDVNIFPGATGYTVTHSDGLLAEQGQLSITTAPVPIPEPSSILLFGLGALGLVRQTRRRRVA